MDWQPITEYKPEMGQVTVWSCGYSHQDAEYNNGVWYLYSNAYDEDMPISRPTHFLIITPPKETE